MRVKRRQKNERQLELKNRFAQFKQQRCLQFKNRNLFVKNLRELIDETSLKEIFSVFGDVASAKVMRENGSFK